MILKTFAGTIFALLGFATLSCNRHAALKIEPISIEFNERFLTGERLDTNYFSTRDVMQYYQVSNYGNQSSKNLLAKLSTYTSSRYHFKNMDTVNNLTLLFYKKRMFVDYSDHLYESARDNDNRTLEGYSNDLIARITYERLKKNRQKIVVTKYLYPIDDNKPLGQTDTLTVHK
ncbi:hypothetical protein [Mucilaginibacter sp. PAMB04168]|uniref:hypothetical protein n=1 Tax=Mucilaginibacter sp. PAMB04168 TaxID=3138567 RepID=UPI0031F6A099